MDKSLVGVVQFDACNQVSGMIYSQNWCYVDWELDMIHISQLRINCKEAISAVVFATDNVTARVCLANETAKIPNPLVWMQELHWYSVLYNFGIEAVWLPGSSNSISDDISRLCYPHLQKWFLELVGVGISDIYILYTWRCGVICLIKHLCIYLAGMASKIEQALDQDNARYRRLALAETTKNASSSQLKSYLDFCFHMNYCGLRYFVIQFH